MLIFQGFCTIKYTPVSGQFQVSGATSPVVGISGDDCSLDYIVISGGGPTAGSDGTYDR